ncbi:hypothetical protein RRSWK_02736 [Rhodopirellula sp. SWK7]|nr:hypothetical protein RRSWK_02736 [Rhodopirellula sp. SWK7]
MIFQSGSAITRIVRMDRGRGECFVTRVLAAIVMGTALETTFPMTVCFTLTHCLYTAVT